MTIEPKRAVHEPNKKIAKARRMASAGRRSSGLKVG
jgi:hypothetical protein